jgi:RNA polymerase sigma-70 factor, ECF subfamily
MSFSSWYQGYYARLLAALTVVAGDSELAADATAEAFTRALEGWDRASTMTSPEGWTYRVGLNVLRRRMRRAKLERRMLGRPEPATPAELHPEVWQAVKELSPRQREAIALRYLLGMSEAEVAEALGVAVGTASATLSAARSRLATLLSSPDSSDHDPSEVER